MSQNGKKRAVAMKGVEAEINALRSEIDGLVEQVKAKTLESASYRAEMENARLRIISLYQTIDHWQEVAVGHHQHVSRLQQELAVLERENADLSQALVPGAARN